MKSDEEADTILKNQIATREYSGFCNFLQPRYVERTETTLKVKNDSLSEDEEIFISAMLQLQAQGIDLVMVDHPSHNQVLFPNEFNPRFYNNIVPGLVQKGFPNAEYDAPRDGPQLCLSKTAINYYANSGIQHNACNQTRQSHADFQIPSIQRRNSW